MGPRFRKDSAGRGALGGAHLCADLSILLAPRAFASSALRGGIVQEIKKQAAACFWGHARVTYFDAAAEAAAGIDADAEPDAAACFLLCFFGVDAAADAIAEAEAGADAIAEAEADADGAAAAKAAVANRETNRAAIILDMLFPFYSGETRFIDESPP
jgi:hypothetical protein